MRSVNEERTPAAYDDTLMVTRPCYSLPLRMIEISRPPPITAAMT